MKKYYPFRETLDLLLVISFVGSILLSSLARIFLSPFPIIMWTAFALFWVGFFLIPLIVLPFYFSRSFFEISPEEITKQTGVIFQSRQIMKMSSIQYLTRIKTPFSKFTGFNFLGIHALGGHLTLMYLSLSDIDEITDFINSCIKGDVRGEF